MKCPGVTPEAVTQRCIKCDYAGEEALVRGLLPQHLPGAVPRSCSQVRRACSWLVPHLLSAALTGSVGACIKSRGARRREKNRKEEKEKRGPDFVPAGTPHSTCIRGQRPHLLRRSKEIGPNPAIIESGAICLVAGWSGAGRQAVIDQGASAPPPPSRAPCLACTEQGAAHVLSADMLSSASSVSPCHLVHVVCYCSRLTRVLAGVTFRASAK